jgi:hypothetical protein
MKESVFRGFLALPMLAALIVADTPPAFGRSDVGVNLNIHLGPPVIATPPSQVVLIPGSDIYFVPGVSADIFFYSGYWWSPRGARWYRAYEPSGPWVVVERRYVPSPLFRVPRDYRAVYRGADRIPYGHWKKMRHRHGGGERHDRGRHDRGRHDRGDRHDRW